MNISLTPELRQFVVKKVESGMYHSASEVVREGLRMLKENQELHKLRLDELRNDIAIGVEQADRGELIDGEKVFKRLHHKLRRTS